MEILVVKIKKTRSGIRYERVVKDYKEPFPKTEVVRRLEERLKKERKEVRG